jgi:hypothetical protein
MDAPPKKLLDQVRKTLLNQCFTVTKEQGTGIAISQLRRSLS